MDLTLIGCGLLTRAGAVLTRLFLPRRTPRPALPTADLEEPVADPAESALDILPGLK